VKLALLLVTTTLVVVPAAGTATGAKTIGTRGAVISISADGSRVAIHAELGDDPQCDFGAVWQPARAVIRLGSGDTCPQSDDAEFDGLALAGDVAVWTNYDFGNHAYCAGPFIASLRTLRAVATGACPGEPNSADMHWEYKGSGALLVARSYTPDVSTTHDASVALWSVGPGGLKKLATARDDTKLLDVDAGRILVRDPGGKPLVLDRAGRLVGAVPVAAAAWLDGASRVSVPSGTTLTTYDVASGRVVETCTMKKGARVQDVEKGRAVYIAGSEVHLLTIATNADRVVARQAGLVQADLEPGGLFYAYNVPRGGPKPGRVAYLPLK
jgi:hypothetical protein